MLTKKFQELYNLVGITKGTKRTPIQYSFDTLSDLRRAKLAEFYTYDHKVSKDSFETLKDILDTCNNSLQVYIWTTVYNKNKKTIHGFTVLDRYNRLIKYGVMKNAVDAKIVQFCTNQLTNTEEI